MREKVAAIVGTEMRGGSPDALGEVAASLKLLVRRAEQGLRTVNKVGESSVACRQLGGVGTGRRWSSDGIAD